jgi:predicted ArsR family transcriptional regulator
MKKFIAFNGSANSGIQTHDKAIEWAQKEMAQKTALAAVNICEVMEVVERVAPVITTKRFMANDFAEAAE